MSSLTLNPHFHTQNESVCEHDRKSENYIDVTQIQRTVHLNQFILFFWQRLVFYFALHPIPEKVLSVLKQPFQYFERKHQ